MIRILITGGSGMIGHALSKALERDGHEVRWLTRGTSDIPKRWHWDPTTGIVQAGAFDGVSHIIHLSGAGIADERWTEARKRELFASRGGAARQLLKAVKQAKARPSTFISASGINYYGAVTTDHVFTENDPPGTDTIARITVDWEEAADEWASTCRVVKLRTPLVLAHAGGLKKLVAPIKLGLGAGLGHGHQWMPWVHIADLVAAYQHAIAHSELRGAYNVVAEEQPTNKAFMRTASRVLRRPFFLPNVPAFALRLALGELSSILLEGSRAESGKLRNTGFRMRHDHLEEALADLLIR